MFVWSLESGSKCLALSDLRHQHPPFGAWLPRGIFRRGIPMQKQSSCPSTSQPSPEAAHLFHDGLHGIHPTSKPNQSNHPRAIPTDHPRRPHYRHTPYPRGTRTRNQTPPTTATTSCYAATRRRMAAPTRPRASCRTSKHGSEMGIEGFPSFDATTSPIHPSSAAPALAPASRPGTGTGSAPGTGSGCLFVLWSPGNARMSRLG